MQNNPVLRVAFVAVIAILAMVFMMSLFNRYSERHTIAGAAYGGQTFVMDASGSSRVFDESGSVGSLLSDGNPNPLTGGGDVPEVSVEEQQAQLTQVIAEQDPQQKLQLARQMSRFGPASQDIVVGAIIAAATSGSESENVIWDAGDHNLVNPGAID